MAEIRAICVVAMETGAQETGAIYSLLFLHVNSPRNCYYEAIDQNTRCCREQKSDTGLQQVWDLIISLPGEASKA